MGSVRRSDCAHSGGCLYLVADGWSNNGPDNNIVNDHTASRNGAGSSSSAYGTNNAS